MNRIFRKVWNRALGQVVVASELARGRSEGGQALCVPFMPAISVLAVALLCAGSVWAQDEVAATRADADTVAKAVERYLQSQDDAANDRTSSLLFTSDMMSADFQARSTLGGGSVTPMGVINPGGLTGGTLPGLVQHLTNFLLPISNEYRACGLLGNGTLLPDECLTIARENFSYAFQSVSLLGTDLLVIPDVLDLNGNRPADHTTIIGRASSGSYINIPSGNYAGQVNDPDCELVLGIGLCVPGVLGTYTWETLPAQDYQIIIGDGAAANGSNTVVLGTNASHTLPAVSASDLGWTGGPDGNYDARLGNAVVIGHGANGTADRQTILGANASSTHANSVALGAGSITVRGAQASYLAPGLGSVTQVSAGEVSVGAVGSPRQITNVAAGSVATDAVNVGQMLGAIAEVNDLAELAVQYDDDGFARITLAGPDGTTIGNVAAGVEDDEAVNVGQLSPVVAALGGGAAIDPVTGAVTGPTYTLDDGSDTGATLDFGDVGGALENLDGRTASNTTNINNLLDGTEGLVRQDPGTLLVTVAGQTGGDQVSFANVDGDARRLSDVADGIDDSDAANIGQLRAVEDQVVDLDALAVKYDDATLEQITLGGADGTVIGNVGAGEVSATSADAVNGGQLFGVSDSAATHLGGGAAVNADGSISAPTYTIQGGNYGNVGDAFDAVDGLLGDAVAVGTFAVRYDDDGSGNPDLSRVTLAGPDGTTVGNVAAGEISLDSLQAINGGQLYSTHASIAELLGGGASIGPAGGILPPSYFIQGGSYDNVGAALAALNQGLDDTNARVDGLPLFGDGRDSLVAVDGARDGSEDASVVEGSRGVAVGADAVSEGEQAIAIGGGSLASGSNATAIGGNAQVEAMSGTAIGANTLVGAAATNGVAVGEGASVVAADGTALGQGASVTAASAIALGQGSVADRADSVSVGSAGNERQITNVAAGTADTDAVNLAQLRQSEQGTVRYDTDGEGNTNPESITLNRGGNAASIRNVRAGVAGTDAVNVNQLNAGMERAIHESNAYTDMRVGQMQSDIWEIDRGYRAGVASAMAVAGLPQAYVPGRSMIAAAVSGYEQEAGIAVGLTTVSENGRWVYKFSGTTNTRNDLGVTMGAGLQW